MAREGQRAAHIPLATLNDPDWADATVQRADLVRCGGEPDRAFLDQTGPLWAAGKLANKAGSAMASAQSAHGGQETTVQPLKTPSRTGAA